MNTTTKTLPAAVTTTTENAGHFAAVTVAKAGREVRVGIGFAADGTAHSSLKMTRQQAEALIVALTAALEA